MADCIGHPFDIAPVPTDRQHVALGDFDPAAKRQPMTASRQLTYKNTSRTLVRGQLRHSAESDAGQLPVSYHDIKSLIGIIEQLRIGILDDDKAGIFD